ncbi:MAG: SDR family oxidoreductase [Pseudomonadota bacterium]
MSGRFAGQTVLITGAAGGFGRGAAEAFAAEGARLLLADRDAEGLAAVADALGAERLAGDAADPEHHRALVALAAERLGGLDVALNNAGIVNRPARTEAIPEDEARAVIEVDLLGVFWALQAQLPLMQAQFREGGRRAAIVNLASVAGLVGSATLSIYAAAKHGVVGLTRTAAVENARRGIRVNAVCPSFARTAMVEATIAGAPDRAAAEEELARGVPMRRIAEVEEVVAAILFAADPANSFMTGQTFAVDGGITAY